MRSPRRQLNRRMAMIIIEVEAPQQTAFAHFNFNNNRSYSKRKNYFKKKWNALDYAAELPLFIKILALMATE